MSEPVQLGQILSGAMRDIGRRMEANKINNAKNNKPCCDRATARRERSWEFNRQINVSVLIQLIFLASLIVGSWINLQRQLDLLQRDVTMLLQCQKEFTQKLETLSARSISYEYRLRAIERTVLNNRSSQKEKNQSDL